jgi:hypothetical protein
MHLRTIIALALSACTFPGSTHVASPAPAPAPESRAELEPGMFELTLDTKYLFNRWTSELLFAAYVNGPFEGSVSRLEVRRDGRTIETKDQFKDISVGGDKAVRLGNGAIRNGRMTGKKSAPDLSFDMLEPGKYTLAIVLRTEGGDHHEVTLEQPFEVARLPTTGNRDLAGLAPSWLQGHAALRLAGGPLFDEEEPTPEASFWITLPGDLRLAKTRTDVLFYRDGVLQGRFDREVALPDSVVDEPLSIPITIHGWPADLPRSRLVATPGAWEIHVLQDGRYVTTCPFAVAGGRISGPVATSRALACAAATSASVADAARIGKTVAGYRPTGFRA